MSLLHPLLLGFAALVAVPVVLHLLMRPKPKRLLFPALRLIQNRRKSNTRRLRLRHLWLLLLRMAMIALLVLAVARPVVPAAGYGLTRSEIFRLVAIVVVCGAVYWSVHRWWSQQVTARHDFLYRRTVARAASGALAALLLLVLLLWPYSRRVAAEIADPSRRPAEDRPIAAVFIVDTSVSMDYQLANRSRLAAASGFATEYLGTLPRGSRVAVWQTADETPTVFQSDLTSAGNRIEQLKISPGHPPLNALIERAIAFQKSDRQSTLSSTDGAASDAFARAVYVFTDLTAAAWDRSAGESLKTRLKEESWLQLFLVDVGVSNPTDVAITRVQPTEELASRGTSVTLKAEFQSTGDAGQSAAVELFLDEGGRPVKRGEANVALDSGRAQVSLPLPVATGAVMQGELRLVQPDPLVLNDRCFFTVATRLPASVLILTDDTDDAFYWSEALAPSLLRRAGNTRYRVEIRQSQNVEPVDLSNVDVVYLLNVVAPNQTLWTKLSQFVRKGGGLGVLLGKRVDSLAYDDSEAAKLMPGRLMAQVGFDPPALFTPVDESQPILRRFEDLGGYGQLVERDIRRRYVVEPKSESSVVAIFAPQADRQPALLTRGIDSGRVALLTTGVDGEWSDLPRAGWSYLAFADLLTRYLAGRDFERRNFLIDETIVLRPSAADAGQQVVIRAPDFNQQVAELSADRTLTLVESDQLGHYEIALKSKTATIIDGWSVNLNPAEADLTRLDGGDLDALLGEDQYGLATDPNDLELVFRDKMVGVELLPFVLILMVVVVFAEQVVSNRFYDSMPEPLERSDALAA